MEKFKITKEQLEFIESHSNFIHTSMDNKYSFIPFWFEHKDDNNITLHSLGNLPKDLSDYITNDRNATSNVPVNEEDHKKEFPLTPEECFKPNTESSVVKTDIETGHTPTSEHYKKAREIIFNQDIEKQCPLCDGKGIREFPNCTPPIKEPCPGCEGEKKYTSMKDAFGMMTPKEAREVSENMKEHNIFDKEDGYTTEDKIQLGFMKINKAISDSKDIEDKTINFGINLNDSDDEDE